MTVFPVALVNEDNTFRVFQREERFIGNDGVEHPVESWRLWTDEDWARQCPGVRRLPLVDTVPFEEGKKAERLPEEAWVVAQEYVRVTYHMRDMTEVEIEAAKPPVPQAVTNFQARAALLKAGLFDQVNNALLAQPVNSTARQAWEYANELTRNGTLVNSVSETLGLSAAQLDDLFRQAATIEA
jgi:hypothetical protein